MCFVKRAIQIIGGTFLAHYHVTIYFLKQLFFKDLWAHFVEPTRVPRIFVIEFLVLLETQQHLINPSANASVSTPNHFN